MMDLDCVSTRELQQELDKRRARSNSLSFAKDIGSVIIRKLNTEERCWLRKIIQDQEMFGVFCAMLKDAYDKDAQEYDP